MKRKTQIMDEIAVVRALTRLSFEIVEKSTNPENIVLIGIKTRGIPIAERIAANIKKHSNIDVPICTLDITFFRDDITIAGPTVKSEDFAFDINGKECIICDDVLYTGRTVRAAIEAIFANGRPGKIGLAVLVDRGHRELPIRPDYVGKNVPTSQKEVVKVSFAETDQVTEVSIFEKDE